jgi:hypothetical protein
MAKEIQRDIIQETLSLSKSGGIYFAGERIDADENQMSLFVGLGGTGASALIRMKHQIYNRMKLPVDPQTGIPTSDHPTNVAFLALDTDDEVETLAYGNTMLAKNGSEYFNIGVSNKQSVLDTMNKNRVNNMPYAMWYPDGDKITAAGGTNGAGGKRPVGRALFFNRASAIRDRISEKLLELNRANPTAKDLRIFLFTGIGGGTGSGYYLDVAYMLRDLGKQSKDTAQVFGYIFLPDLNSRDAQLDYLKSNGFAALKEIDYFMERGESSTHFFNQPYTSTMVGVGSKPMDYCHLINATDVNGSAYDKNEVMKSVVESVFCYVANSENTFSLKSHYDNISNLLIGVRNDAKFPAAHQYLSVGSASVQIPYMEVTTLLAERMFEKMDKDVFSNPVTKTSLQDDMSAIGLAWEGDPDKGDRMLQDTIRRALERNVKQPNLTDKKYDDIWDGTNTAYNAAYDYIVRYQDAMNTDYAIVLGEYEGLWRKYLKSAIRRQDKGPIYLANMTYSNETPCIIKMLRTCADYYQRIANNANRDLKTVEENLEQAFSDGRHPGLLGKGKAKDKYLDNLKVWMQEQTAFYAYKFMSKMALELSEIFEKYYKYILKDLKDTLQRVRLVFSENLRTLEKKEQDARLEPDPSVLIYPLAFEKNYHTEFEKCVDRAYNGFLNDLSDNLRYWIGREIDDVSQSIVGNIDIEGHLSDFISSCFEPLYSTITMETILSSKKGPAQDLGDYVQGIVKKLYATSYPLFKKGPTGIDGVVETAIISIPTGCPEIASAVNSYVSAAGLSNATVKISDEKNRIEVVKISAGFALYQNAYIGDWEKEYESNNNPELLHLCYGWKEKLPSPNVQVAWMNGYRCKRTEDDDAAILRNFDRCYEAGLIEHELNSKEATLLCGNSSVVANGIQLGGTLQDRIAQLNDLKTQIWNRKDPNCKVITMQVLGVYLDNGTDEGKMSNIRANIVRDPEIRSALQEQCDLLDLIQDLEEKLSFPKHFVRILLCELFKFDTITRNIYLKREENDPMPKQLMSYASDNYDVNAKDFWYKLYLRVTPILKEEARAGITWKEIVDKNWQIMVTAASQNEMLRAKLVSGCARYGDLYFQLAESFKKEASLQVDAKKNKALLDIANFYDHAMTELLRIYNDYK